MDLVLLHLVFIFQHIFDSFFLFFCIILLLFFFKIILRFEKVKVLFDFCLTWRFYRLGMAAENTYICLDVGVCGKCI